MSSEALLRLTEGIVLSTQLWFLNQLLIDAFRLRRLLMNEIDEFVGHEQKDENSEVSIGAVKHNFCTEHPEICQAMFYVSELDMLKAVRYALLQEVTRMGDHFSGDNLTAIITFYDDLIQNFPTVSTGLIPNAADVDQNNETITLRLVPLNKSVDAVDVFEHMKQWLESAAENDSISIVDYENEFKKSEVKRKKTMEVDMACGLSQKPFSSD
ncbi:hypothetical protein AB6A40_010551 [Gnathostoma spinigerum]|uniref:Uncharacterized protein n=1 Tax=Gnathostoma spinigerum TaxID=75299 RepID=A0ABD6F2X9_9BILA